MKDTVEEIVNFIKDYVKESGKEGVVLGISGGIDSAVVAILCKRANVKLHMIYLPDKLDIENDFDRQHINKLCRRFDLTKHNIAIGHYVAMLKDCFGERIDEFLN